MGINETFVGVFMRVRGLEQWGKGGLNRRLDLASVGGCGGGTAMARERAANKASSKQAGVRNGEARDRFALTKGADRWAGIRKTFREENRRKPTLGVHTLYASSAFFGMTIRRVQIAKISARPAKICRKRRPIKERSHVLITTWKNTDRGFTPGARSPTPNTTDRLWRYRRLVLP
jgi:hypothetical protein